jgi:membrane protein
VSLSDIKNRLDKIQRGHRWLAFPYAVVKKYGEDSSGNLAVLMTYYLFFSIFPLLLALSSVVGYVLAGHPALKKKIEDGAYSSLQGLSLIKTVPLTGSAFVIVIGVLLALYSGLGVAKSAQNVGDIVYGVPRDERPNFLWKNLRALRLILVGGLGLLATTVVSTTVATGSALGFDLSFGPQLLGLFITFIFNTLLFALIYRWVTVRDVTFRQALPGALICAVTLGVLQSVASIFIAHKLKNLNATYGAVGTVLVLLSWFYIQCQVWVLSAQVNVVKHDHLWPRSLNEPAIDEPMPTISTSDRF